MIAASLYGGKHTCSNCNNHFYDLNKLSIACPKCGVMLVVPVKAPVATPYKDRKTAQRQSRLRRLTEKRERKAVIWKT